MRRGDGARAGAAPGAPPTIYFFKEAQASRGSGVTPFVELDPPLRAHAEASPGVFQREVPGVMVRRLRCRRDPSLPVAAEAPVPLTRAPAPPFAPPPAAAPIAGSVGGQLWSDGAKFDIRALAIFGPGPRCWACRTLLLRVAGAPYAPGRLSKAERCTNLSIRDGEGRDGGAPAEARAEAEIVAALPCVARREAPFRRASWPRSAPSRRCSRHRCLRKGGTKSTPALPLDRAGPRATL